MLAPPICRRSGGTTPFRPASSDEDGGNPANIAASGASNQKQRDARAVQNQTSKTQSSRSSKAQWMRRLWMALSSSGSSSVGNQATSVDSSSPTCASPET
jgi:hypothetical protein